MNKKKWNENFAEIYWFSYFSILTGAIWFLIMGWRPGLFPFRSDALEFNFPPLFVGIRSHLLPDDNYYDPSLLGGGKPFANCISPIFQKILFWGGFSASTTLLALTFSSQILFGFFIAKSASFISLGIDKSNSDQKFLPYFIRQTAIFVLAAFAPFVAIKSQVGHFAFPICFFPAFLTLYFGIQQNKMNWPLYFLATMTIWLSLQSITFYVLSYGLLLGMPMLIASTRVFGHLPHLISLSLLLLVIGCGLGALPFILEAVKHYGSSDSPRNLSGNALVYAYASTTLGDWLASIFWGLVVPSYRPNPALLHEVNHAFGPLLLFGASLWRKSTRPLCIGLLTALIIGIAVADDWAPLSTIIIKFVPLIANLRVPSRFGELIFIYLIIFSSAEILRILAREKTISVTQMAMFCVVSILFFILPPLMREVFAWSLAIFVLTLSNLKNLNWNKYFSPTLAILALAILSILAFKDRFTFPPANLTQTSESALALRQKVLAVDPDAADPLNRIELLAKDPKFWISTDQVVGVSTLRAYTEPLHRFVDLYYSLYEMPYEQQAIAFMLSWNRDVQSLYYLYNVRNAIGFSANGDPEIRMSWPSAGRAWLPTKREFFPNFLSMGQYLKNLDPRSYETLKETALISQTDPLVMPRLNDLKNLNCLGRKIEKMGVPGPNFNLNINLSHGSPCLMVISTSFAENIKAIDQETKKELITIPVYGSLLGVILPPESNSIHLEAQAYISPRFKNFLYGISILMFALVTIFFKRLKNI